MTAALAPAACGGGGSAVPPPSSSPAAISGRQVFARACQACHSISGHNRPSQQGGDLRAFHPTRAQLRQLTAEMPVRHHRLSPAELAAVVDYVAAIERRG